mgnify:CR=1 FL=1
MQPQARTTGGLNRLGTWQQETPFRSGLWPALGSPGAVSDDLTGLSIDSALEKRLAADLRAFVTGSIAALLESPKTSACRLCLQLFLLGAANRLWARGGQGGNRSVPVLAALLDRYGLPGSEAIALSATYRELEQDPTARRILHAGAEAMEEFVGDLRRH